MTSMISILVAKIIPLVLSKTARNTFIIFLGNSVALVLAFFYTIILYRILSLSDFGYYSALFSFLLLFTDITDVGIGSSLSRFLPPLKKNQERMLGFLKSAFIAQLTIVFVVFVAIIFTAFFISEILFHSQDLVIYVRFIGLGIVGAVIGNFFLYAVSAKEKFVRASVLTIVTASARLVFLLILIYFAVFTLPNVIWALVASFIFSAIIALILVDPKFLFYKSAKKDFKALLGFSSFLGIARSLTTISSRLDVLMLMALTNSIETGIYSTASRVAALYPVFTASFISVIGPRVAIIKDKNELKNYFTKIILATIGLVSTILVFIIIAQPFMIILFGEKSSSSVQVLQLLFISMIFFTASIPAVTLSVYYLKKPFILTINSIMQLIIVVAGNLIFIPLHGRIGATFSLIGAYGLSFVLTTIMGLYYLKKEPKVKIGLEFATISPPETV